MTEFIVHPNSVKGAIAKEQGIAKQLINAQNSIGSIMNNLQFNIASSAMIRVRLKKSYSEVYQCRRSVISMSQALDRSINKYEQTEKGICSNAKVGKPGWINESNDYSSLQEKTLEVSNKAVKTKSWDVNWKDGNLKGISSFGTIGKIVSGIGKVVTGDNSKYATWGSAVKDLGKGIDKIAKTAQMAKKDPSVNWKEILVGFDKIEVTPGFTDNFVKELGKVNIVSGALSAFASTMENVDEFKQGGMSEERFLKETAIETGIDILKGVAVTAAVSSVCALVAGTVAVPAVVVGGISAVAIWGADVVSKNLTGKKVNDLVGDFILDLPENIKAVKNSKFVKAVGSKIADTKKTLGNAVSMAKKNVSNKWNSITKWAFA